ncbi:MAG TPA: SDR family oxidoreductase [Pyrinomonadaceae bacterium]|nr:SDR family oxidoreductase [Pyrinomonadaceae bacterium]
MRLANKLAFITGGSRGIGQAIAQAFAREGASVAILARTTRQVKAAAKEIAAEFAVDTLALRCDVQQEKSVLQASEKFRAHFGRGPDIVVNNAGVARSELFINTDERFWELHLNTNIGGTFRCTRAALPGMIERGWGRIINIASIAGKTGAPYISAYAASKHAVLGLTRSLALEVAEKGITVNAICPGYVDTEMTSQGVRNIVAKTGKSARQAVKMLERMSPQNRLVTPEEVAAVAVLLASDEGRGINGQAINVDGGTVLF